jgi:AmmeMemoRadiSam system protein A
MTSQDDRTLLLRLARNAIVTHLGGVPEPIPEAADVFIRQGGAFVTIHSRGELRGCIGQLEPGDSLGIVIPRCAVSASSADPRFPPVSAFELPDLDIEISLLGPLEPIAGPDDCEIGRHGLVVEMRDRRGLLLPQVASEWNWDRDTFLAQTCQKAGLPRDAWRHGAKVWRFEAEVFAEGRKGRLGG